MPGRIVPHKKGKQTYYYFQESYRAKVNPTDSGKKRGSGKSSVRTRSTYLGTAEAILRKLKASDKPVSTSTRRFGLLAAAHQTATKLGLPAILAKHIEGTRCGIPRWIFFYVTILNRLDHATSKNKMAAWLKKTILPDLLHIKPSAMTSKTYWYAADDVISERELQKYRETTNI